MVIILFTRSHSLFSWKISSFLTKRSINICFLGMFYKFSGQIFYNAYVRNCFNWDLFYFCRHSLTFRLVVSFSLSSRTLWWQWILSERRRIVNSWTNLGMLHRTITVCLLKCRLYINIQLSHCTINEVFHLGSLQ